MSHTSHQLHRIPEVCGNTKMFLQHLQKNLNEGQICLYGRVLQVGLGQYDQDQWARGLPNRHFLHKEAHFLMKWSRHLMDQVHLC